MSYASMAWGWMTISLALIAIGIVLICLGYLFNQLTDAANTDISRGLLSNQTRNEMEYAKSWWGSTGYIILIVGFLSFIITSVQSKAEGG